MKDISNKKVGVVGAGNFGTVMANLIAGNQYPVLLYARNAEDVERMQTERLQRGYPLHENIESTHDFEQLANLCEVIFLIVPSLHFRNMMRRLSPYIKPHHVLIHGAKGLDLKLGPGERLEDMKTLSREQVRTMSEVIREESVAMRIGALAGPNLSRELAQRQPTATVIASRFNEVIQIGKKILRNDRFMVYESSDIIGVEISGALKNVIAIAAGALFGLGYGDNAKGLLISRGAVEMVYLGRALGGDTKSFLGIAGIGDLVTTCNSQLSRNFTVGKRLAEGETLSDILRNATEVAEGIESVRILKKCADYYKIRALITDRLYKVLFENKKVEVALDFLMRFPLTADIDFM